MELLAAEILEAAANGMSPGDIESIKLRIYQERDRITLVFKKQFLAQENETLIKRFFLLHQQGIVDLIDLLFTLKRTAKKNATYGQLIDVFQNTLNQLLDLLKNQYSQFFDFPLRAPKPFLQAAIKRIEKKAEELSRLLHQDGRMNQSLIDSMDVLINRKKITEMTFSFDRVSYYEQLLPQLLLVGQFATDSQDLSSSICTVLIRNNFNTPEFFSFYTSYLTESLEKCESLTDKIDLASWHCKKIGQMNVMHNVRFDKSVASIKVQLLDWLTHELDYLREKKGTVGLATDQTIRKDFKLQFDMSVAQLAFLFRVFVDAGLLQNKNTSELIRFITKFVSTKKSEAVSYDSFRLKFYDPETGTKDAVKNMLLKLHSYISRN